ncbi:hypothetical protein Patl1_24303 [Pistacia atlantica]|uniref:Uncharacterized protein n=1 Tax=Pistacia atlantica TaxID=434234 RepID=A0ACC0ZUY6_9ROSI|nr:hypothetical protein Patl1_24303 [Pistacia atlantica]
MNIYKNNQLESFFIYSLTVLSCSLLCSSPFWFPSLCSSMKVLLFVSLPKVGFMIVSPKLLFIMGNLIAVILIRESKFFALDTSSESKVYYDKYIKKCKSTCTGAHPNFSTLELEKIKEEKQEKYCSKENVVLGHHHLHLISFSSSSVSFL